MADNGVAGARSRSSEVVLSPGVRPGMSWGRMRAVLRYAGSCLVFKYDFVASDPSSVVYSTKFRWYRDMSTGTNVPAISTNGTGTSYADCRSDQFCKISEKPDSVVQDVEGALFSYRGRPSRPTYSHEANCDPTEL
jgi:hypothetical protein